jgi:hypothetical protein
VVQTTDHELIVTRRSVCELPHGGGRRPVASGR